MALIKSQHATDLAADAVVLDLGDLRRQGARLLAQAESQANGIIAEARVRAAQLTDAASKQGHDAGFAAGFEAGRTQGVAAGHAEALDQSREAIARIEAAWVAAAQTWDADRRTMLAEARHSLVGLALRIAEKIVRRVPTLDPSVVADQVAEAVDYVARPCDVTVRIHPDDRPLVAEAMPALVERLGGADHVSLADDPTIARGGCVVTYGSGRIDATLDTQLTRITQALLPDGLNSEPGTRNSEL